MNEQQDGPRQRAGNARFTSTEVTFHWQSLPEDLREDIREDIAESIEETIPVEDIASEVLEQKINQRYEFGQESDIDDTPFTQKELKTIGRHIPVESVDGGERKLVAESEESMPESGKSKEVIIDEVNKRVVAPLVLGTAILLFFAAVGTFVNGSILLTLLILPAPILATWTLWKMIYI